MGSYTTNFLWNHPKPGDGLYDYSGGMINTPDTAETQNFTKNQLPVIDTSNPQVNKASMIPDGFIDKMKSLWGGIPNTDVGQTMNANTNYAALTGLPHSGFEEMDLSETVTEPQKKGSNSFGIPSMFLNMLNTKNPLSKRSSNYNPNLAGQIEDLRNVDFGGGQTGSWLGTQSSPYQIAGGPLAGKNLVSMFGTNDYDQMLADKQAWFEKRIADKKDIGEANYQKILDEIGAREAEKKAKIDATTAARAAHDAPGGRHDYNRDRGGGYTLGAGFADRGARPGADVRGHHSRAQGGYMRSEYNRGGRVGILAAF